MPSTTLAQRIRSARLAVHLPVESLASEIGVHKHEIHRYEMGKKEPDENTLRSIAAVTGETYEFLRYGEAIGSGEQNLYDERVAGLMLKNRIISTREKVLFDRCETLTEELVERVIPRDVVEQKRLQQIAEKAAAHGGIDHLVALDDAAAEGRLIILPGSMTVDELKDELRGIEKSKESCGGYGRGYYAGFATAVKRILGRKDDDTCSGETETEQQSKE